MGSLITGALTFGGVRFMAHGTRIPCSHATGRGKKKGSSQLQVCGVKLCFSLHNIFHKVTKGSLIAFLVEYR